MNDHPGLQERTDKLEPDLKTLKGWLKGKFRSALKEYYSDELGVLWNDFTEGKEEVFKQRDPGFFPSMDMAASINARKEDVEKVLAFKPVAEGFLSQQESTVVDYVGAHTDYLHNLLQDKIGSGVGSSRAELVLRLSEEISTDDDPPSMLVALYVIKHAGRFVQDD